MQIFALKRVGLALLISGAVCLSAQDEKPEKQIDTPAETVALPVPPAPDEKPAKPKKKPKAAIAEEIDLLGDKPEAAGNVPVKLELMERYEGIDPLDSRARDCYALLEEIRDLSVKVSEDLDGGGKEVTRLIRNSDKLAKKIGDLADLWPEQGTFRDNCITSKRSALLLNDELSQSPRRWQHVRWSFRAMVQDVRKLRAMGRDLADAEPKPIQVTNKNGKLVYVDAPTEVDPEILRRQAVRNEVKFARDRLRKFEDAKKNQRMPLDLNDEK